MPLSRHQSRSGEHDDDAGRVLDRGWRYDAEVWLFDTFIMRGQIGRLRQTVLQRTELGAGQRMLDVGCGTGTLAIQAARLVGTDGQVAGIDPAPRQIARAQAKARRAGYHIDFRQATVQALPFADDSFDAATSTLMMHHLPGEVRTLGLAEIHRILKPRGRLVVADFNAAPGDGHSHGHGHGHGDDSGGEDLAEGIAGAGFAQVTTSRTDFDRTHHGWSGVTLIVATKV